VRERKSPAATYAVSARCGTPRASDRGASTTSATPSDRWQSTSARASCRWRTGWTPW